MNIGIKIHDAIAVIKATSSKNSKQDILKNFIDNLSDNEIEIFKKFIFMVHDISYAFGIRQIPKVDSHTVNETKDITYMFSLFESFAVRKLTGNTAKNEFEKFLLESESKELSELSKMLINKSFDCGMSIKSINKAFGFNVVIEHLVMLQEPATDKLLDELEYPCYSQMKMDALRIEIVLSENNVSLVTRGGFPVTTGNPLLDDEMLKLLTAYQDYHKVDKVYVDGEMLFLDNDGKHLPRKTSNGIANKCIKGTKEFIDEKEIQFAVWDILTQAEKDGVVKTDYQVKYELLTKLVTDLNSSVYALPETFIVNNKQEAIDIAINYVKQGIEGSIVKSFKGHYQQKRVKYQIKLKAAREIEVRVTGYNISKDNKYHGLVGSIICETDDGLIKVSISGMSDFERKDFIDNPITGKVITVLFNEVISNEDEPDKYSLFLPRIEEIRFDKDTTDTLESAMNAPFIVVN